MEYFRIPEVVDKTVWNEISMFYHNQPVKFVVKINCSQHDGIVMIECYVI